MRNHALILSLSGLEHAAARAIHRLFPHSIFAGSTYGRGHVGEDLAFQREMMEALAVHPNIGACLVLGPDDKLFGAVGARLDAARRPWTGLSLQGVGEDRFRLVEQGARALATLIHAASRDTRTPQPLAALSIAIECGHSDARSGLVSNPLVGALACRVVADGGRAVFSETLEWTGTEDLLASRAATPEVADATLASMDRRHAVAKAAGHDLQANNAGPRNHAGGITTLEEKSLGSIAKGGEQPIVGLLGEGKIFADAPGLYLMDTPCFSPESMTSMIAAGARLALFTTGEGNPYVSAVAPTLKVSANPDAVARLPEQIDFDVSAVVEGSATTQVLVFTLHDLVLTISSGALTWGEAVGGEAESVSRLGPSI